MPSELESALRSCSEVEDRVGGLIDGQDTLLSSASQLVHDSKTFTTDNQAKLTDIACVRGVVQYTVWLRYIIVLLCSTSPINCLVQAYGRPQR